MAETTSHTPHLFQISLKAILEDGEGRILGLKNTPDSSVAEFYDLPGGRIGSDELEAAYADILARELEEEIGTAVRYELEPHPVSLGRHNYYSKERGCDNSVLMVFFRAKYLGGEVRISEEHVGYEWIDPRAAALESYFTAGWLEGLRGYLEQKRL